MQKKVPENSWDKKWKINYDATTCYKSNSRRGSLIGTQMIEIFLHLSGDGGSGYWFYSYPLYATLGDRETLSNNETNSG